jgi:transcription factor C subunit 6
MEHGQETLDRFAAKKARSKNPEVTLAQMNPGAWAPEVSVQRVTWNNGNGLGNCQLLASGTASGLCRIDWVGGRWFKDQTPGPGGIEALRGEVGWTGMGMLIWMTLRVREMARVQTEVR